jgi:hypothetical protein
VRYGLDFFDLQNPKVRRPTVRLEQRIMISTEIPLCTPTMNGGDDEFETGRCRATPAAAFLCPARRLLKARQAHIVNGLIERYPEFTAIRRPVLRFRTISARRESEVSY